MEKTGEGAESPANLVLDDQEGQRECSSRPRQVVTAVCLTGLAVVIGLLLLSRVQEAARRSLAKKNLEELGLVFRMYADDDPGERFPPVSPYPGVWAPDLRVLYPKYLHDPSILINPLNKGLETVEDLESALEHGDFERASRIVARNYTYTGWAVLNIKDIAAIRKVLRTLSWDQLDRDITADGHTVHRLRVGIEQLPYIPSMSLDPTAIVRAVLATAFENVDLAEVQHVPPGCNVLYLDGHVDFIRKGVGRIPVVPIVAETFPAPEVEP